MCTCLVDLIKSFLADGQNLIKMILLDVLLEKMSSSHSLFVFLLWNFSIALEPTEALKKNSFRHAKIQFSW